VLSKRQAARMRKLDEIREGALLADLHRCCPEHRNITRIADLDTVALTHWEWYWERWYPSYFRNAN
jgi:hypothetical protein